jgi:acetyltransferase-like isoleucine patch superfamily enzyme
VRKRLTGRHTGIGPHVCVLTSSHILPGRQEAGEAAAAEGAVEDDLPILRRPLQFAPVTLADGCDIGVGANILPGVTVGRLAQVGAGAVVTQDVPPRTIVAGNPARVLRRGGVGRDTRRYRY